MITRQTTKKASNDPEITQSSQLFRCKVNQHKYTRCHFSYVLIIFCTIYSFVDIRWRSLTSKRPRKHGPIELIIYVNWDSLWLNNGHKNQIYLFLWIRSEELINFEGICDIFYHRNYHICSESINFSYTIVSCCQNKYNFIWTSRVS